MFLRLFRLTVLLLILIPLGTLGCDHGADSSPPVTASIESALHGTLLGVLNPVYAVIAQVQRCRPASWLLCSDEQSPLDQNGDGCVDACSCDILLLCMGGTVASDSNGDGCKDVCLSRCKAPQCGAAIAAIDTDFDGCDDACASPCESGADCANGTVCGVDGVCALPSTEGEACETDEQCTAGLVCNDASNPPSCLPPGLDGWTCGEDADCDPALLCNALVWPAQCQVPGVYGQACAADADCQGELVCNEWNGWWVPGPPMACQHPTEGLDCDYPDTGPCGGLSCEITWHSGCGVFDDAECSSGNLGSACDSISNCVGDLVCFCKTPNSCNPQYKKTCLPPGQAQLGAPCPSDAWCAPGLTCNPALDVCEEEPGSQGSGCFKDDFCDDGLLCNDGFTPGQCQPPGQTGDPCKYNSECDEGLACKDAFSPAQCQPQGEIGDPCTENSECLGECEEGACVQPCESDIDCDSGLVCGANPAVDYEDPFCGYGCPYGDAEGCFIDGGWDTYCVSWDCIDIGLCDQDCYCSDYQYKDWPTWIPTPCLICLPNE